VLGQPRRHWTGVTAGLNLAQARPGHTAASSKIQASAHGQSRRYASMSTFPSLKHHVGAMIPIEVTSRASNSSWEVAALTDTVTIAAALVGIAGVIGSLLFSGYQTRNLVHQTKIQNEMARAVNINNGVDRLSAVYRVFIDYPELRRYFYEGAPMPAASRKRARVLTVAEMIADTVDSVILDAATRVATGEHRDDWNDYIRHILAHSPTLVGLASEHPRWWPEIMKIIKEEERKTQRHGL
jgi:hypothetical protein